MKIKFLTEEGIDVMKSTLISIHRKHLLDATPDYFVDYFHSQGWLKESKYEVPDIDICEDSDFNISDPKNIKAVYESLKSLPPAVAADGRVWAGLSFTDMWHFVQYRRKRELAEGKEFDKLSSFFFMRGGRRSCFIHCISRLWWVAYLLYDSSRADPYELCNYFASRAFASRIMLFSSVNLVSNPEVAKGIVECHYNRFKEGKDDGRYPYTEANKYLNCLGGISLIDSMHRQEVYDIVWDFLEKKYH